MLKFNGDSASGLGISTVQSGNVVVLGEEVRKRLAALKANQLVVIDIGETNFQPEAATEATNLFAFNLLRAVSIVFVVLLIAMGRKAGFIIGIALILTILATIQVMYFQQILIARLSLRDYRAVHAQR